MLTFKAAAYPNRGKTGGFFTRPTLRLDEGHDLMHGARALPMRLIYFAATLLLTGCSGNNTGLSTLQMNSTTLSFPEHYQVEAAKVARDGGGDPATAKVSRPAPMIGAQLFSPQRWYSCVLGLPGPQRHQSLPNLTDAIGGWIDPTSTAGVFNVVMIFDSKNQPSIHEGFDSPLCRNVEFEPITATAPAT